MTGVPSWCVFGYRATPAGAGSFRVMDGHLIIGVGVIQVSGQATVHFVTAQVLAFHCSPNLTTSVHDGI